MAAPMNPFKSLLADGGQTIGMWMNMTDPYMAEVVARAGFDWVLIDAEHAPNDIASVARQLQVVEPHVPAMVRLPMTEPWLVKQALDAGVQSLLAPMVNSADEARRIVRAMRYPPEGVRGVGYHAGRASHFNLADDYAVTANGQMCLIVQIETRAGYQNIEEIVSVDGVDGAFVGPSDLAADMGFLHDPNAPEMQEVVADALTRIASTGKPAGIIDGPDEAIQSHFDNGASFVAVGCDIVILAQVLRDLATKWKGRVI